MRRKKTEKCKSRDTMTVVHEITVTVSLDDVSTLEAVSKIGQSKNIFSSELPPTGEASNRQ